MRNQCASVPCNQTEGSQAASTVSRKRSISNDAEAHRKPVVVLAYDLDLVGKRKGSANGRVESSLLAAEGAHVLIEIMETAENPDAKVGPKEHVRAGIDIEVNGRAVLLHAESSRIGRHDGREVLVVEVAPAECAAAHITFQKPAPVEIKPRVSLGSEDRKIAIGQS
jgi:hypothetical protein